MIGRFLLVIIFTSIIGYVAFREDDAGDWCHTYPLENAFYDGKFDSSALQVLTSDHTDLFTDKAAKTRSGALDPFESIQIANLEGADLSERRLGRFVQIQNINGDPLGWAESRRLLCNPMPLWNHQTSAVRRVFTAPVSTTKTRAIYAKKAGKTLIGDERSRVSEPMTGLRWVESTQILEWNTSIGLVVRESAGPDLCVYETRELALKGGICTEFLRTDMLKNADILLLAERPKWLKIIVFGPSGSTTNADIWYHAPDDSYFAKRLLLNERDILVWRDDLKSLKTAIEALQNEASSNVPVFNPRLVSHPVRAVNGREKLANAFARRRLPGATRSPLLSVDWESLTAPDTFPNCAAEYIKTRLDAARRALTLAPAASLDAFETNSEQRRCAADYLAGLGVPMSLAPPAMPLENDGSFANGSLKSAWISLDVLP